MGFFDQVTIGLSGVLVEQIKKQGLVVLLLLLGLVAFIVRDNNNQNNISEENRALKLEIKEIRIEWKGNVIENQRKIMEKQATQDAKIDIILEYIRAQQYKTERDGN
jgi:hypothetical protein